MTEFANWRDLGGIVRRIPPGIPDEHRRAFSFTTSGYLFALLVHVVVALAFVASGNSFLVAVAIVGGLGFLGCLVAHQRGHYREPPHVATLIVVTEGALAVYFLGPASGFHFYILAAIVYPWLSPFYGRSLRLAYTIVGVFAFVGLSAFGEFHTPLLTLYPPWPAILAAVNAAGIAGMLIAIIAAYETAVVRAERATRLANAETEALVLNILPRKVAARLKRDPQAIAELHGEVTILFADIVDFTPLSQRLHPTALVSLLDQVFSAFDELAARHGAEKIKTIGDAYMAVAGLPEPNSNHAQVIADLALDMLSVVGRFTDDTGAPMTVRIGISSGTVVAGVIGKTKFVYDLWGDPVNMAGRMESYSLPGKIQVSEAAYRRLQASHQFDYRGVIDVKGKGEAKTWFLTGRQQASGSAV